MVEALLAAMHAHQEILAVIGPTDARVTSLAIAVN
jgi:hypothetical protein